MKATTEIADLRTRCGAGPGGFGHLVRAEWTKLRTVRGWTIGLITGAVLMVLLGVYSHQGNSPCGSGTGGPGQRGAACAPAVPYGPDGQPVTDTFYFVRQPLDGNGSVTARVTALTGLEPSDGTARAGSGPLAGLARGVVPWAKAGIIIKTSSRPGSPYAAIMATGAHGVRMQYNYTTDLAGTPGAVSGPSPRWLRLTRAGATITGYDSPDGSRWTRVGSARLPALSGHVQAGLFVTSPPRVVISTTYGSPEQGGPSIATGTFDHVSLTGAAAGGRWRGGDVGSGNHGYAMPPAVTGFTRSAGRFTLTGSGDIAPMTAGKGATYPTSTITQHLAGAFVALVAIAVVAAMFISAEYRRGMIRTTLTASPRRARLLAAKAIVIGAVTFAVGFAASAAAVILGTHVARSQGQLVFPVTWPTEIRVITGTAALLAVTAVLALAVGTILRSGAAAVMMTIVAVVVPYVLAAASVVPYAVGQWLLRLTPAAAFSIQQTTPQYHQIASLYTVVSGYYPLAPWDGLAVLCAYAAAATGLAVYLLRTRDA